MLLYQWGSAYSYQLNCIQYAVNCTLKHIFRFSLEGSVPPVLTSTCIFLAHKWAESSWDLCTQMMTWICAMTWPLYLNLISRECFPALTLREVAFVRYRTRKFIYFVGSIGSQYCFVLRKPNREFHRVVKLNLLSSTRLRLRVKTSKRIYNSKLKPIQFKFRSTPLYY